MSEIQSPGDVSPDDKAKHESQEGITVAIRMRPLNKTEGDKERVWKVLSKYSSITQTTNSGKPLSERVTGRNFFTFDKVFGEDADTTNIYDNVAKGIVTSAVGGLNGTIFAYGQTSSGKTYTMQGSGSIQQGASGAAAGGIVHMAAQDIFSHIQSQPDRMFLVRASFLEIYNEEVRDLLSPTINTLQVREDPRRGVFVQAVEEIVTDFESLLRILFQGEKSRAIAATGMNERSSRSHTIFKITIESRVKEDLEGDEENVPPGGDGAVRISTLNLVDLAGSESVRHTGATGDRQKEGGMINQSLLTLSRVIVGLGQPNHSHINFRDSKLTRILQPSLSGNARMAVICCATPSELYAEETRSTLQFASRAKLVKTNAQVNEVLDDRSIIRRLQRQLAEARQNGGAAGTEHLRDLENKAASAGTQAVEANAKLERLKASILNASHLFGNDATNETESSSPDSISHSNVSSRKRRQSDGGMLSRTRTPTKPPKEVSSNTPRTAPRRKREKIHHRTLSPRSELGIVRQALNARKDMVDDLQHTVHQYTSLLEKRESELQTVQNENSEIVQSKDQALTEVSDLKGTIVSLQEDFEAAIEKHNALVAEKETDVLESIEKLERTTIEKEELESENGTLQDQLENLQTRFDALQEERVRSAFDLAQIMEEKEKLLGERYSDKVKLQEMNGKIEFLTSSMNESEREREESDENAAQLELELADSNAEQEESLERISELESKNRTLEAELADSKVTNSDLTSRLDTLEKAKSKVEEQLENTKADLNTIETKCGSLVEQVSGLLQQTEEERENAAKTTATLEAKLKMSKKENATSLERICELERGLESVESQLATAEDKSTGLATKLDEADEACLQLKEKLSASLEAQEASKAHSNKLQIQCEGLDQHIVELQSKATEESAAATDATNKLEAELATKGNECAAGLVRINTLEEQIADLDMNLAKSKEEVLELSSALRKLEAGKGAVELELVASQASAKSLAEQLENLKSKCGAQEQQVSALIKQKQDLEEFFGQRQEENVASISDLESKIATLNKETEGLNATLSCASDREKALLQKSAMEGETISSLNNDIAALQREGSDLQSKLESTASSEQALSLQVKEYSEKIDTMESEIRLLQSELSDTREQMEGLSSELESKEHEYEVISERLATIESSLEERMVEADQLVFERDALQATVVEQTEGLESIKNDLEESRAIVNALKTKLEATQVEGEAAVEDVRHQLAEVSDNLATLQVEKEEVEASSEELQRELLSMHSSVVELRTQATAKEIEKSELLNTVRSMQAELDEAAKTKTSLDESLAETRSSEDNLKQQLLVAGELTTHLEQEIEAAIAEKENAMQDLFTDLESARNDKCTIEENFIHLESRNQVFQNKVTELETERSRLTEEIDILQHRLSDQTQEKVELDKFLAAAEEEVQTLQEQMSTLEEELMNRQQTLEKVEHELSLKQNEIEQMTKIQNSQVDDHEAKLQALQERLSSAEVERDQLMGEVGAIKDQMGQLTEARDAAALERGQIMQEKEKLLLELNGEIESMGENLGTLEETNAKLQAEIQEIEESNESYRQREEITLGELRTLELEKSELADSLKTTVEEKGSLQERLEDMDNDMEQRLQNAEEQISDLLSEKEAVVQEMQRYLDDLEQSQSELEDVVHVKSELLSTVDQLKLEKQRLQTQLDEAVANSDGQNMALETAMEEKGSLEEQYGVLNEDLEASKRDVDKLRLELQQAVTSKENLQNNLRDRERERDEAVEEMQQLYEKNRDLSMTMQQSLPKEREISLMEELSGVNSSNVELKQLLASANDAAESSRALSAAAEEKCQALQRDLEDAHYRLSQLEEELRLSETAFEGNPNSFPATDAEKEALVAEIASLEGLIETERAERSEAEESVKKQMGEEQRMLIQEGEKMMQELRLRAESMESRLNQSETEAYTARQQAEEIADQKRTLEQNYSEAEEAIQAMQESIAGHGQSMASLQLELNKARAESYATKESSIEMKEKVRKAERESEKAMREKGVLSSELSVMKRKVGSMELRESEQREEIESLRLQIRQILDDTNARNDNADAAEGLKEELMIAANHLESMKRENASLSAELQTARSKVLSPGGSLRDPEEMAAKVRNLWGQVKQRDQRIKKLEAVRLTKEQVESIRKMKSDNASFEKQINVLEKEKRSLRSQLDSAGTDSEIRTELSELRFDKQALESKLRKFAAHCQHLEDDKAGMVDTMKSCGIEISDFNEDMNDAVVALCDRLATLQNGGTGRTPNTNPEPELVEENRSLQNRVNRLVHSENQLMDRISKMQADNSDLSKRVKVLQDSSKAENGNKGEMGRKMRFLEQENLQLMLDVKTTKKQLQAAREELELNKMDAMENPTMDFGTIEMTSRRSGASKEGSQGNKTSTQAVASEKRRDVPRLSEKTNAPLNTVGPSDGTRKSRVRAASNLEKASRLRRAPGLGEAAVQGDETGECQQS